MTRLRAATEKDTESIVQILTTSRATHLPYAISPHTLNDIRSWVGKILTPNCDVIVAEQNGKNVGVLATSVSDGYGWVDQLYIAPDLVRHGIGSCLIEHALKTLPRPIRLKTFQQNDRAIAFYKTYEFKAIQFTNGEDNEEQCPDILFELT